MKDLLDRTDLTIDEEDEETIILYSVWQKDAEEIDDEEDLEPDDEDLEESIDDDEEGKDKSDLDTDIDDLEKDLLSPEPDDDDTDLYFLGSSI